jgi:hypothetical protein
MPIAEFSTMKTDRLELIIEGGLIPEKKIQPLHTEATELTAIMASSRLTATRNRR